MPSAVTQGIPLGAVDRKQMQAHQMPVALQTLPGAKEIVFNHKYLLAYIPITSRPSF